MSGNDPSVLVRDMLDHAKEAVEMASGRTFDDLSAGLWTFALTPWQSAGRE